MSENLDPLQEISEDADIYNVFDKTGLREPIDKIGGLDARLKQGDGVLSEGQKQLFCPARAMLTRRGGIFIMDGAMSRFITLSSLFTLSFFFFLKRSLLIDVQCRLHDCIENALLRTEFRGWTIIAIVHRSSAEVHSAIF